MEKKLKNKTLTKDQKDWDKYGLKVITKTHPYNCDLTEIILKKKVFGFSKGGRHKIIIRYLSIDDIDALIAKLIKVRKGFY